MGDLRKLAEAAISGPWRYRFKSNALYTLPEPGTVYTYGTFVLSLGSDDDNPKQEATTEYLTACNPERILALLDVVDKARAALDDYDCHEPPKEVHPHYMEGLRTALAALDAGGGAT